MPLADVGTPCRATRIRCPNPFDVRRLLGEKASMNGALASGAPTLSSCIVRRVRRSLAMYTRRIGFSWSSITSGVVRVVPLLLTVLFVMAWSADASAYAWMIRRGYTKCNTCHADPSGGELLNHMGRVQSEQLLSTDWDKAPLTDDAKLLYALDEPDGFLIGGSMRYMGIYDMEASELSHFPMQLDAYAQADFGSVKVGGSIGYADIPAFSPHLQGAQLFEGDGSGGPNLLSRTHWVGFDLEEDWLVRAGRLNLPFGIRTSEHVLYAREATKTDRESDQQHGLALAYSSGRWRGEGMFVLGNYQVAPDDYRERGFVGFAEYAIEEDLAVGLSTMVLQSAKSLLTRRQSRTIRHAHGALVRWVPFDPLVLMGEFDILKTTGAGMGYTGFVTADVEVLRGVHASLTGEVLDAGQPDASEVALLGAGEMTHATWASLQWFFYTHWDFRLDAVMRKDAGTDVQAQVHFYF